MVIVAPVAAVVACEGEGRVAATTSKGEVCWVWGLIASALGLRVGGGIGGL